MKNDLSDLKVPLWESRSKKIMDWVIYGTNQNMRKFWERRDNNVTDIHI